MKIMKKMWAKYPELLRKSFASEAEALECERRASTKMDVEAQEKLASAYGQVHVLFDSADQYLFNWIANEEGAARGRDVYAVVAEGTGSEGQATYDYGWVPIDERYPAIHNFERTQLTVYRNPDMVMKHPLDWLFTMKYKPSYRIYGIIHQDAASHFQNLAQKTRATLKAGREDAIPLLDKITNKFDSLTITDFQDIKTKLIHILHVVEAPAGIFALPLGFPTTREDIARLLIRVQDTAANFGIQIDLPKNFGKEFLAQRLLETYTLPDREADISYLMDSREGPHLQRMQRALEAVNRQVRAFDEMIDAIRASIAEMAEAEMGYSEQLNHLGEGLAQAVKNNEKVDRRIRIEKLRMGYNESRQQSEMAGLLAVVGASLFLTRMMGLDPSAYVSLSSRLAFRLVSSNAALVSKDDFARALIATFEEEKVDVEPFFKAIEAVSGKLAEIAISKPMLTMQENNAGLALLYKGYLRRQVLTQGLENAENLAYFVEQQDLSIDDVLAKVDDSGPVGRAISQFSYGLADSNDLNLIIAYADTLQGDGLQPFERALKEFVEEHVKPSIDSFIPKSSRIDVITEVMPDFSPVLSNPMELPIKIDTPALQAMGTLVKANFSTVGSQKIDQVFAFNLHRHGNEYLRATRLNDGQVSDMTELKGVNIWTSDQKREFIDRVIHSYQVGRIDLPKVDILFLRICAAEYFLPQSVKTSGRDATFVNNPQAPAAYPMVNDVVGKFITDFGFTSMDDYRQVAAHAKQVDALVAQSFIDFFARLGEVHSEKYATERERLAASHDQGTYGQRYRMYARMITSDALKVFGLFQEVYAANMQRTLEVSTSGEALSLLEQLRIFGSTGKHLLGDTSHIIMPGTPESMRLALTTSRRFRDMSLPHAAVA